MKTTTNSVALKILFFLLFVTLATFKGYSQITSHIIRPENIKSYGVRLSKDKNIREYRAPAVDVTKLLKEDVIRREQGKPFRFGKDLDVNIDIISAATKSIHSDTILYEYQITSKNAYSINLIFDSFILAENASLLIYNSDNTMVYGPVTAENNPSNKIFWTDLIKGESIIIQLLIRGEDTGKTRLHLGKVIHAYQNTFSGYGQSASCNRDVNCFEGNPWTNESSSVAMVLLANGTEWCSGALLNNACQDFTPNFLTAFHCIDTNENGVADEPNQLNWVFRFFYANILCGGSSVTTYQAINGATVRAASQASDFALLLLQSRPTDAALSGWSRSTTAATSAAAIHHPNGDVKKISIDNDALTNVGVTTNWATSGGGVLQCPPNTHWQSIFETGTVQPGSSGSPIFNQDHRIVGQLHGDYLNTNNDYCTNRRGHYGRFDVSWTGGGIDTRRLSTWLTNDPGVMTTNTLIIPRVAPATGTGTPTICTGNQVGFNLVNAPSSATHNVVWTTTSNLTIIAQGSSSVLVSYSGTQNGVGTVTANISSTNSAFCSGSTPFSFNVQAGPFNTGQVTVSGQAGVCNGNSYTYYANVPGGHKSGYTYAWTYPSGWSVNSQNSNSITLYVPSYNNSYGTVRASVNNGCGASSYSGITVYPGFGCSGGGYYFAYSPNPTKDELTIEALRSDDNRSLPLNENIQFETLIIDGNQSTVRRGKSIENKVILELRGLEKGTYYLKILENDNSITERIIVID